MVTPFHFSKIRTYSITIGSQSVILTISCSLALNSYSAWWSIK